MNKQYINGASFEYAIIKTLESEKSKIYKTCFIIVKNQNKYIFI